jgi:hypothetical protein
MHMPGLPEYGGGSRAGPFWKNSLTRMSKGLHCSIEAWMAPDANNRVASRMVGSDSSMALGLLFVCCCQPALGELRLAEGGHDLRLDG